MKTSIECKNVSIKYVTGDLKAIGLKEYIVRHLTGKYHVEEFWADRNVTFKISEGDMLGIIGTNGAGKSTLLKAISGIMRPAEGSIHTHGRIAAILELTSGFDGNMTVRENTFLRGAMLGYTKEFMNEMYGKIIDFAELEEFQEYNFNQLSSGMKSRLAFAIACLVDPDIIILDEVLSVGDGAFKIKSGEKMREILDTGVTGILVSHSVHQVRELCNKILWLDHGKQIIFSDDVNKICNAYEGFLLGNKLPENQEDIEALAEIYEKKMEEERLERIRQRTKKLENLLEKGSNISPVSAAINVVAKHNPELLNMDAVKDSPFALSVDFGSSEETKEDPKPETDGGNS
ncbi:MAG: ABC transporter ATP-binding protein [Clostridiales bacterium]|nr:ABC transporter ATP-binding protein [Clostridiales bacterium]